MTTSSHRSGPRPGGRSARVQAAVHAAVRQLQEGGGSAELTVPLVATLAGVTPSTVYRRWGDLAALLADVAVERLRPDTDPLDTGSFASDLAAWSEQYLEEMSSPVGRAMVRDVLSGSGPGGEAGASCQCYAFTQAQLEMILDRARERGEGADGALPTASALMDDVVAPILYRLLFSPEAPGLPWLRDRLALLEKARGNRD